MHYTDLMLKFDDEAQAKAYLYEEVPTAWDNTDPENPVVTETESRPLFRNIDTLGVIYTGGSWDEEGNQIEAPAAEDGWHVNLRCLEGENAVPLYGFIVTPTPATPRRIWA